MCAVLDDYMSFCTESYTTVPVGIHTITVGPPRPTYAKKIQLKFKKGVNVPNTIGAIADLKIHYTPHVTKIWPSNGEVSVTWETTGGNMPNKEPSKMFDSDLITYWHGFKPISARNTLKIDFPTEIQFKSMIITTSLNIFPANTYRELCVKLDSNDHNHYCTSDDFDIGRGKEIKIGPETSVVCKELQLVFADGIVAQISDLKIN